MIGGPVWGIRYIRDEDQLTRQRIRPGTVRRVIPYAARHRKAIVSLLVITAVDAVITAVNPLLLALMIDDGILRHRVGVVVELSLAVAGLALVDAFATFFRSWYSAKIGEGLVFELRTSVFRHVQRQPLAFFTRTQTGSLVSRLNNDVNEAQRAITMTLATWVSTLLTLVLVLGAMFYLSWQIT